MITSDVSEMEYTIRMRTKQPSSYHNTLARLEDEIAMNSTNKLTEYMNTTDKMSLWWKLPSTQ